MTHTTAKPFLKWAGGKQKVIPQLEQYFPKKLKEGKCKTYIDGFVGGGSLLFHVIQKYPIERAIISDTNEKLITTYKTVKENVDKLINKLKVLQERYYSLSDEEKCTFYYKIRDAFNQEKHQSIELAAQFIFLNKTCFNGLYRENKKGKFNVPIGRYLKPVICDEENLRLCSKVLQQVEIYNQSYEYSRDWIDENTFCVFDPPLRPIDGLKNFTKYLSEGFGEAEQINLSTFYSEMNKKGAKMLLCTSDPTTLNPEDDFFDINYCSYNINRIHANRCINSNPNRRGKVNELVITNY